MAGKNKNFNEMAIYRYDPDTNDWFPFTGLVGLGTNEEVIGKVGIDQTTPGTTNKIDLGSSPAAMTLATGEVQGNTSATVFPTLAVKLVNIKALPDNAGKVYIGVSGVTKADGTTDTTTGWVLSAGEETGFLPLSNMSSLYRICDNAGDDVVYLALS